MTGPDLTNGLTGVLCHFRKDPITGCANYGLKYLASMNEKVVNRLMKEIQAVCSNGKLHFHKYISNSREVLEFNSVCDCTVEVKNLNFHHDYLPVQNVLLKAEYIVHSDSSTFNVELNEKPPTRSGILSIVASVYVLLGFLTPFVMFGKRVPQEMCLKYMGRYESVPIELRPRRASWLNDLPNLGTIQIPRCFTLLNFGKCLRTELHHLFNGSSQGYGYCSCIRLV